MGARKRDLDGQTVVITRPAHQAASMADAIFDRGGFPVELPLIAIEPPHGEDRARLIEALARLGDDTYAGFIVTSANTVRLLDPLWPEAGVDPSNIEVPVYAVGPRTGAALASRGIPNLTPEQYTGEALVRLLLTRYPNLQGLRFLFPRAKEGRETVVQGLSIAGAQVEALTAYHTVPLFDGPHLPPTIRVDWLTFTSPSAAEVFALRTDLPPWTRVACIGPTTAEAARRLGFEVAVVSPEQTVEAMLDAMIDAGPPPVKVK